jgi:hypothetical protein
MSTTETTHRRAIQAPFQEIAKELQEILGQRLVAYVARVRSPKAVGRWATGENRAQRFEIEQHVRDLYRVIITLAESEQPETIRAWLLAANPQLEDRAPIEQLRDGDSVAVLHAAINFIEATT